MLILSPKYRIFANITVFIAQLRSENENKTLCLLTVTSEILLHTTVSVGPSFHQSKNLHLFYIGDNISQLFRLPAPKTNNQVLISDRDVPTLAAHSH